MADVSQEPLRIRMEPHVTLALHDGAECIVHVPGKGSYKVDEPTFGFLRRLAIFDDGYLADSESELRPDFVASLRILQSHGIVAVTGDLNHLAQQGSVPPMAYSGELADLVLRREVPALSRLLAMIAVPLAQAWSLPVVIGLALMLPLMLLGGAIFFDFEAAYAAWFRQPLTVMGLTVLFTLVSGLLHEAGHVAAARRNGVHNPKCGVGFYVHRPVFYVDVTAIDTHPRLSRVHVDLGGIAMDGLTLLGVVVAVHVWYPGSGIAYAVISALAVSSLAPLNPVTKSDINWCGRDFLGARGLSTSWGRPRQLLRTAISGAEVRERRFARLLVLSSALALVVLTVAGLRSVRALGPILREGWASPASFVPILIVWALTILGIMATVRAVRRQTEGKVANDG